MADGQVSRNAASMSLHANSLRQSTGGRHESEVVSSTCPDLVAAVLMSQLQRTQINGDGPGYIMKRRRREMWLRLDEQLRQSASLNHLNGRAVWLHGSAWLRHRRPALIVPSDIGGAFIEAHGSSTREGNRFRDDCGYPLAPCHERAPSGR